MYRHILLAYDGSPEGAEALHQVVGIASGSTATIHLLVVIEQSDGIVPVEGLSFADPGESVAERVLDEGLQALRLHGLEACTMLRHGGAAEQIGLSAREVGADLVVVGHRKQNAIMRWLNGSVASDVLNRAPCSILVAQACGFHGHASAR